VVCHGSGCKVTFSAVKFAACTIVALQGAQVTVTSSSFSFDTSQSRGLAVFANGHGTSVRMHGSSITGGTQGVTIQVRV
jgi:hypothetical protein